MKKPCMSGVLAVMTWMAACGPAEVRDLDTLETRASYAIGMDVGNNLQAFGDDIDIAVLVQGLRDALDGDTTLLTLAEARSTIQEFATQAQAALAERNREEGREFLAENGERDGVTTTASGLQYEVIHEGTGATPTADDRVRVHYAGTFTDGTPFESTYDSGTPVEFAVTGVIPGWTEGLQLMTVGSKYRFFISGDLAYGEMGSRGMEPNKTLIFEVELVDIL